MPSTVRMRLVAEEEVLLSAAAINDRNDQGSLHPPSASLSLTEMLTVDANGGNREALYLMLEDARAGGRVTKKRVGLAIGAVSYPYTARGAVGRDVLERSGDLRKDDRWHTAYVLQFTKLVEGDLAFPAPRPATATRATKSLTLGEASAPSPPGQAPSPTHEKEPAQGAEVEAGDVLLSSGKGAASDLTTTTPEKRDDIAPDSEVGATFLTSIDGKGPHLRTETIEEEFAGSPLQSPDSSLRGYFSPTPLETKMERTSAKPKVIGRILDGPRKPAADLVSRILFDVETQSHWDVYTLPASERTFLWKGMKLKTSADNPSQEGRVPPQQYYADAAWYALEEGVARGYLGGHTESGSKLYRIPVQKDLTFLRLDSVRNLNQLHAIALARKGEEAVKRSLGVPLGWGLTYEEQLEYLKNNPELVMETWKCDADSVKKAMSNNVAGIESAKFRVVSPPAQESGSSSSQNEDKLQQTDSLDTLILGSSLEFGQGGWQLNRISVYGHDLALLDLVGEVFGPGSSRPGGRVVHGYVLPDFPSVYHERRGFMSAEVAIVAGAGSGLVGTAEEVPLDGGEKPSLKNTEPKASPLRPDVVVSSHDDTGSEDASALWHDLDQEHPAFAFRWLKNFDDATAGEDAAGAAWRTHLAEKLNIPHEEPAPAHDVAPKRGGNISNLPTRLQHYDRVLYIPATDSPQEGRVGSADSSSPQTGSTFFSNPKREDTLIVDVLRARHSFGDFFPFWRIAMEALALGRCERVLIVGFGNGSGADLQNMRRYKHFMGEDLKRRRREWMEVNGESVELPFWLAEERVAFLDGTVLGEKMEFLKGGSASISAARRAQRLILQEFYCGNDSSRFITRHYPWSDMVKELELPCLLPRVDNVLLVRVSSARWGFEEMKKEVETYLANANAISSWEKIVGRISTRAQRTLAGTGRIFLEDYRREQGPPTTENIQLPRTTTSTENGGGENRLVSPDVKNDWMDPRGAEDAWFEYASRQAVAEGATGRGVGGKIWYLISQHAVAMPKIPEIFKENVGAIVELASGPIPEYSEQNAATPVVLTKEQEEDISWEVPSLSDPSASVAIVKPASSSGCLTTIGCSECLTLTGFLGKKPTRSNPTNVPPQTFDFFQPTTNLLTTFGFFQTFPRTNGSFSLCTTMGSMAVEPSLMAKLWAEMMKAVAKEAPDLALRLFVHAGTGGAEGVDLKTAYTESLAKEFANWKGPSELVYHVSDRMQTNPRPFAKHCDVFFHQGSAGTQMDATRLRKPQLVMPYWLSFDHVPNALYIQKNNLGGFVDFYANLVNEDGRDRVIQRGRALAVEVYKQVAQGKPSSAPSKEARKSSPLLAAIDEHAQNIRQQDAGTAQKMLDYLYRA